MVFERLFNVTTTLRRPRGLRARLHSPRPEAPNLRKPLNSPEGRRPPGSGWAARFFCQPHHFSGARVKRGPEYWRDRLGGLAGPIVFPPRRSDRENRLFINHRGPTLTRVPEKWIRWLVNRGEGLFEARSAVNWVFLLTFLGTAGPPARGRS